MTQSRHHSLDLLRGLAAIGVATYHYLPEQGIEIQSLGTFTVYLFFVLSGLTMIAVYGKTFSCAITATDLRTFYWHRITRIMPLLAAASLTNFILGVTHSFGFNYMAGSAVVAFMTGTALFALQLPAYLSNTIGAWSLGIEMMFYALFPVACLMMSSARYWQIALSVLLLIFAQQIVIALMHRWVTEDPSRFWQYYSTFLIFSPFFALGMLIIRSRLQRTTVNLLVALAFFLAIVGFSLVLRVELFETHWAYLLLTGAAFCAVLFAYASRTPKVFILPAAFLGNASYALYLTHPFSLRLAEGLSNRFGYGPNVTGIMYLPLALLVAHYTYLLFERPAQNYLRATRKRSDFAVPTDADGSVAVSKRSRSREPS